MEPQSSGRGGSHGRAVTVSAVTVEAVTVPRSQFRRHGFRRHCHDSAVTVPTVTVSAVTVVAVTDFAVTDFAVTVVAVTVPLSRFPRSRLWLGGCFPVYYLRKVAAEEFKLFGPHQVSAPASNEPMRWAHKCDMHIPSATCSPPTKSTEAPRQYCPLAQALIGAVRVMVFAVTPARLISVASAPLLK